MRASRLILLLVALLACACTSTNEQKAEEKTSTPPAELTDEETGQAERATISDDTVSTKEGSEYTRDLAYDSLVVEKVKLVETVDNSHVSYIPRLRALRFAEDPARENEHPVIKKINAVLLDRFMVNSYEQSEVDEFRWYDLDFTSEIKDSLLLISFFGEYYGAYPSYVEDELYFNLITGEHLRAGKIPFHSLFTLQGYTAFMEKYWLTRVREEFATAIACAESEPYCSYLDIDSYGLEDGELTFSLTDDCYARVVRACSPSASVSVAADSVRPYLNPLGKNVLFRDSISDMSGTDYFVYYYKLLPRLEESYFVYGSIDGKYPITMALQPKSDTRIEGYYYYDNKREKIWLKGEKAGDSTYRIYEFVDGAETGVFTLMISTDYISDAVYVTDSHGNTHYWKGTWSAMNSKKELPVTFQAIKM
ncbi:MAG: hypothetical protein WBB45_00035 [Cyclobacteriaceae bacterium]